MRYKEETIFCLVLFIIAIPIIAFEDSFMKYMGLILLLGFLLGILWDYGLFKVWHKKAHKKDEINDNSK